MLQADKGYFAERRLSGLCRDYRCACADELVERLRDTNDHELRRRVVESLLIHETSFFRDPKLMERLAERVIPALVEARAREKRLRIWCAACSTGQEPYTLAILLHQYLGEDHDWDIRIVGSDMSGAALEKAESGAYSITDVNRGMPVRLLVSHFQQQGLEWQVSSEIRAMTEFRRINLVEPWPELPVFDMVLLRNVLIYFADHARRKVLDCLHGRLRSDGYLVLGGTERVAEPGWRLAFADTPSPFYRPTTGAQT